MAVAGSVADTLSKALRGRCPRCGKGPLFVKLLELPPSCAACGLDYTQFDPGDGPAVFGILIVGAIVAGGALWLEFTFSPPLWVQAAIWIPGIAVLSLGFLRLAKALLVVLQYRNQAQEGRRVK
ncbi:MAG: DUF983 domain-containing protein [Alphaproteobacteria bacterium]|nr:DUF983 domain-containing protein [Alphaproteobacteria bacterium]